MKRFHFRLGRIERFRSHLERGRRLEHAAAMARTAHAERALQEHDRETDRFLDRAAESRRRGDLAVEAWHADDVLAAALRDRRAGLADTLRAATLEAERTRAALVVARRDLETVESLHESRRRRWTRELEVEMQKQSDEMHRARRDRDPADGERR